jgi:transcription elongation factor Elf1
MKDFNCIWCETKNNITAMVSAAKMPVICKCGTKLGYIDWEDLRSIINERDYYKKKFYERTLTKRKG